MPRVAASKYGTLTTFLAAQPPERMTLTLTLVDIARIVGAPLPVGVHGRAWWTNTRASVQGRAWLTAGWRVERVVLRQAIPAVVFVRAPATASPSDHAAVAASVRCPE